MNGQEISETERETGKSVDMVLTQKRKPPATNFAVAIMLLILGGIFGADDRT
jgi:hypothetical protein